MLDLLMGEIVLAAKKVNFQSNEQVKFMSDCITVQSTNTGIELRLSEQFFNNNSMDRMSKLKSILDLINMEL